MSDVRRVSSVALAGMQGAVITVEAAVSRQLPGMAIIGLPDTALAEAKLRVRAATAQAGLPLADRFLTVNLRPASLPKHGSAFDLAIALAVLAVSGHLPEDRLAETAHLGELGLGGDLRRPAGLLSLTIAAQALGFARVMVPDEGACEAELVPGIEVIGVRDLREAVGWHRGERDSERPIVGARGGVPGRRPAGAQGALCDETRGESRAGSSGGASAASGLDIREIVGQSEAVTALAVAAAGRHHVSLLGPPGAGKTLLASRLPTILPELGDDEALEVSSIASLGSETALTRLIRRPPFESPHHTASAAAVIGSGAGAAVRPGALTRAHRGVLFLDEAPEFSRTVLESLRQPLESGRVEIHRAQVRATMPARIQLVLAANPCPCGNAHSTDPALQCQCTPSARLRYQQRISGPLADRLDLQLELRRVSLAHRNEPSEDPRTSAELRARVAEARACAGARLHGTGWRVNAEVPGAWLRGPALRLPATDTAVLDRALSRGALTLRGYDRVLRVAWSIADLAGTGRPRRDEIAQALVLRSGGAQ